MADEVDRRLVDKRGQRVAQPHRYVARLDDAAQTLYDRRQLDHPAAPGSRSAAR